MGTPILKLPIMMRKTQIVSSVLVIILLGTTAKSHSIHKRHDIIESAPSIDKVNVSTTNGTFISTENEESILSDDAIAEDVDDVQNTHDRAYSVESNNVNNVQIKMSSTTDVNNGIEQNFGDHNRNETTNASDSIRNFTKEFSQQESVENTLPSKSHDKSSSRDPARVTAVSIKDSIRGATSQETHSSASLSHISSTNVSEKPKRLDSSFTRSTERAHLLETSTVPVSHSTVSILSTQALAPKIATTEMLRPQRISSISSEVIAEKRAKYLSDSHIVTSSPSSIVVGPEASWSNLKTVGEVNHNNVTLGRSSPLDESIKMVNGKIGSEEVIDKGTVEMSSTEKVTEDHETQLQKSNSSRIGDVQVDNSLSSLPSSSNQPVTLPVTTISSHKIPITGDEMHQEITNVNSKDAELSNTKEINTKFEKNVSHTNESEVTLLSSMERMKIEENTMIDKSIFTTTEEVPMTTFVANETMIDGTTTIDDTTNYETTNYETTSDETTILNQQEVTTISVTPAKTTDYLNSYDRTTIIPTTEDKDIPTTPLFIPTTKHNENKQQGLTKTMNPTIGIINTTESVHINSIKTALMNTETESTTPIITKPLTRPTKPIITKPTENKQKIITISKNEAMTSSSTTEHTIPKKIVPDILSTIIESTESSVISSTTPMTSPKISVTDSMFRKMPGETQFTPSSEHQTEISPVSENEPTDINALIAIIISIVAVVSLILLVGFLYVMRKRQKQLTYSQRCRPIGLDAYSLDNISIYNSVRRKSAIRSSKRAFGNAGFDDPGLKNNPLNISQLATFSHKRVSINDEFRDVPTVTARIEEVPIGCEDKNRYANVVPLPESRVHLKQLDGDEKTEYINANFVKGPKDTTHYYIACQAPLEHTVVDFWRMIWEQNSRVIIMATDLTENGIEKCAEYLPSSFVVDNHVTFGDFQITLKNRDVRDKYAVSTVHLKNACTKTWREITHFWYQWPENGVPNDEASVIAMLLEARSYLKMVTPEQSTENGTQESDLDSKIGNGNLDKTKSLQRIQGPLTVHCSPGTGRTGTIISCDIAIRSLEQPTRSVDIPQIVYFVRRGRASAVQTREQYEFIYKVAHVYATKLTGPSTDN